MKKLTILLYEIGDVWHWRIVSTHNKKVICDGNPNGYSTRGSANKAVKDMIKSIQAFEYEIL